MDSPPGYTFLRYDYVVFYKLELNDDCLPEVKEYIKIDKDLNVKLFLKGFPVSLPHWFRYGNSCKLSKKIMLENFLSYLKGQAKTLCFLDELKKLQFQKKFIQLM